MIAATGTLAAEAAALTHGLAAGSLDASAAMVRALLRVEGTPILGGGGASVLLSSTSRPKYRIVTVFPQKVNNVGGKIRLQRKKNNGEGKTPVAYKLPRSEEGDGAQEVAISGASQQRFFFHLRNPSPTFTTGFICIQ